MDLVEFLNARLDEDEEVARDAAVDAGGTWKPGAGVWGDLDEVFPVVYDEGRPTPDQAAHIARNDPARVLADVAAKRQLVADHPLLSDDRSDDELHEARAHPAYEYETREGQRKAWDGVDTPPKGDGWELNRTESLPDAFERFDYTEERYWRRRRNGPPVAPWIPRVIRVLAMPYADHPDYREEWRP